MSKFEFTGKTVEEAIEEGLKELNLTKENAEIIIIDEPVKGLIRSKKAKVNINKKITDGERAINFIDELLEKMDFNATSELKNEGEKIIINLITTSSSSIIGYRGEVLDAFQTLAGAVANTGRDEYKRVVVDCENYRGKREETLINLAKRLAEKAIEKARKVTLEPMNPYERRIIHSALADNENIKTISEGKEPNRFIAIIPNNARPYERRERTGYDKNKRFEQREPGGYRGNKEGYKGNKENYKENYNKDRNNNGGYKKPEYNRDRKEDSTLSQTKKTTTFGTYLGNSFKD